MLTAPPRASHPHARRAHRAVPVAADAHLAADRRHAILVAAHRTDHARRPVWLRWLEVRGQPGQRAF